MPKSQPTCADRVNGSWQSTRQDLHCMYGGTASEVELRAFLADQGEDAEELRNMDRDELDQQAADIRGEYGLEFSYVAPDTFEDQPDAYYRYLFSTGGPGTELRFYPRATSEERLDRAEYWFLDWYDGANITVTTDEAVEAVWQDLCDTGSVAVARNLWTNIHSLHKAQS